MSGSFMVRTRASCRRPAFSLIELLVVIAIIAILMAILMPAVQKVRESANAVQCKHKLKQIGIGLHSYVQDHRVFPPGLVRLFPGWPAPSPPDNIEWFSWMTRILPYVEQKDLYDQINFSGPAWYQHPLNEAFIPLFWCDSDPRPNGVISLVDPSAGDVVNDNGNTVALTEYLGASGTDQLAQDGILYVNSRVSFRMITDGTSNTLLVGERSPSYDDYYGWWFAGAGQPPVYFGACDVVLGTNELMAPPATDSRDVYRPGWIYDPPNSHITHFWSMHPGGANFLFADGSVHFLAYDIGQDTFMALGTRAGGEVQRAVPD
jgi:prepilin-type N-terminal cleavage/methylation domain-containing protein/prepilin-type processing-associated H-X9-DG protein